VTLKSGQVLCLATVCEIFQGMVEASSGSSSSTTTTTPSAKKEAQKKGDYARCLGFLCDVFIVLLSDKKMREDLLTLSPKALEELLMSDELTIPDESYALLLLGAWAERRADLETSPDEKTSGTEGKEKGEEGGEPNNPKDDQPEESPADDSAESLDEEIARKLQEEEMDEDKLRKKLLEEEDERLARALQYEENAGATSTPAEEEAAGEDDDEEPIPEYKLRPEYIERIKKHMMPFIPYIRFAMLPLNVTNTLANEALVPKQYLFEAFKYHAVASFDTQTLLGSENPRFKPRRYLCTVTWDRNWHGLNIEVSRNGRVATKTVSSWYSVACGSQGFREGKHFWAVKVDGAEAYVGFTLKENTSLDNYLGGNPYSWAFRPGYKYSAVHGNGFYGQAFVRGDVIGVLLDMTNGSASFYKNGTNLGVCFTGLPRDKEIYPAVGWRAGSMALVTINSSDYSSEFFPSLLDEMGK